MWTAITISAIIVFLTVIFYSGLQKNKDFITAIELTLKDDQIPKKERIDKAKEMCRMTPGLVPAAIYITIESLEEKIE